MCSFIVLMPSVRIYNVNSHENKEKMRRCVQTFDWQCMLKDFLCNDGLGFGCVHFQCDFQIELLGKYCKSLVVCLCVLSCYFQYFLYRLQINLTRQSFFQVFQCLSVLCVCPTGEIQFHTSIFISTNKIDISRPWIAPKAGLPHIIRAHGEMLCLSGYTIFILPVVNDHILYLICSTT